MEKEYKVKERGVIQQIIALAASVIVVGVLIMIGMNIMATTYTTSASRIDITDGNIETDVFGTAVQTDLNASLGNAFSLTSDVTGYFTILYLAVIGGIAIAAILGYLAFNNKGGSSGNAL